MKYYLIAFAILFVVIKSHAQEIELDNTLLYKNKVTGFGKMKQTGGVLIGVGVVSTIGGLVLIKKGDEEAKRADLINDDTSGLGKVWGGLLLTGLGIHSITAGTILAIIGGKKQKQYQSKLDNLRLGYYQSSGANGISLVYTF